MSLKSILPFKLRKADEESAISDHRGAEDLKPQKVIISQTITANLMGGKTIKVTSTGLVKYPEIKIQLIGTIGNASLLIARVNKVLKDAGVPDGERESFYAEATAGGYDHLLQTVMKWVEVE